MNTNQILFFIIVSLRVFFCLWLKSNFTSEFESSNSQYSTQPFSPNPRGDRLEPSGLQCLWAGSPPLDSCGKAERHVQVWPDGISGNPHPSKTTTSGAASVVVVHAWARPVYRRQPEPRVASNTLSHRSKARNRQRNCNRG